MNQLRIIPSLLLAGLTLALAGCKVEPVDPIDEPGAATQYFLGIESPTASDAVDVLTLGSDSLTAGEISPVGNGFEQPAWMTFVQGVDQIFATGYTSAPEFTSYELEDGVLTQGSSFFTDLTVYALDVVDEASMVLMGSTRSGLSEKKIYRVNTNSMSIEETVTVDFGNEPADSLMSFPTDLRVRDGYLFVSYYLIHASGDFSTPGSNEAKVAVFTYPGLEFQKIIVDDRAPNLGRYYTLNTLEMDEQGDIYAFAPSSLACGYAPVPANNSSVLRIKAGETEFDASYHIDFEALSGGYKINDLYYVADGKAVVRVLKEDENDAAYLWATYAPTSENPLLETGILDLYNETFTLLPEVPKSGGGWNGATLVEDSKLYLGISNSTYAGIYVIDVAAGTATEGATVDGNYTKGILSLTPAD